MNSMNELFGTDVDDLLGREKMAQEQTPKTARQAILDEATAAVCGDRDRRYGRPEESFGLIARLWSDYLHCAMEGYDPRTHGGIIEARDVAVMMCLFKLARIATGIRHRDNWVDLAGYAACGGEIEGA